MRCDDLTAYLDGQTGFLKRLAMRAHLIWCAECRRHAVEWQCLSRDITRLEGEPVPPALKEKLMADATAAADARSLMHSSYPSSRRTMEAKDMKKLLAVAGSAALLIAVGAWLLPRNPGNYALADVARAMSNARSVHFVGWFLDQESSERRQLEGWIKGPDKYRMIEEGHRDQAIDGDRMTTVTLSGSEAQALIQSANGVEQEIGIAAFRSNEALDFVVKKTQATVTERTRTSLNGVPVTVLTLSGRGGKALIYINEDTDLIARFEQYSGKGELRTSVDTFEYDTDIPAIVFKPVIPSGIPVIDTVAPVSEEIRKWRREQRNILLGYEPVGDGVWRFKGPGLHQIDVFAGHDVEAPHHPGFTLTALKTAQPDRNAAEVFYLPDKNVYRVLGAVRIKGPNGFSRVVEDGDIRLPGKP